MINTEVLKNIERQTKYLYHLADQNEITALDYIQLKYTEAYQNYNYKNNNMEVVRC